MQPSTMNSFINDFGDRNPVKTYKCKVCGRRFLHDQMGSWGIVGPEGDKDDIEVAKQFNLCKSCFEKDNEMMFDDLENLEI